MTRQRPARDVLAEEFELFVRARTHSLLRSAYLLTGDQQLAEDLVQSALARVYRVWPRLDERSNAEAYVRKAMYHIQASWWRRRRPAETLGLDGLAGARGVEPAGDGLLAVRLTLRQALARLTVRQRAVLVLRFYEDRSEAETADMLGVSTGTVKSQTAKALARLRTAAPELADLYFPKGAAR